MTQKFRELPIELGKELPLKYDSDKYLKNYSIVSFKNQDPIIYEYIKGIKKIVPQSGKRYKVISVTIDKKPFNLRVHRLVLFSLNIDTNGKPFVNHIDGNPSNNSYDNLEWCTPKENIYHARSIGLMPSAVGTSNPSSVLSEKNVLDIVRLKEQGLSHKEIAQKINTYSHNVIQVLTGKNWSSLTGIKYIKKKKKLLNYKGRLVTVKEASLLFGVDERTLRHRIRTFKWDHVRAIETPSRKKKLVAELSRTIKEGEG